MQPLFISSLQPLHLSLCSLSLWHLSSSLCSPWLPSRRPDLFSSPLLPSPLFSSGLWLPSLLFSSGLWLLSLLFSGLPLLSLRSPVLRCPASLPLPPRLRLPLLQPMAAKKSASCI